MPRLLSQPETSQSAESYLAATIRWVSGVVEVILSQLKTKQVESQQEVETVSQPDTSQSAGSVKAATIRCASGVVAGSPSQPKTETNRKSARSRDSQSSSIVSQPEVPWRPELGGSMA